MTTENAPVNVISMEGITKRFARITANDGIDFDLREGEIHALLGENGAGKSTLMSILFGLTSPDEGTIRLRGQPVRILSPNDATRLKIGMVHQHFKLVGNFTLLENIALGAEDVKAGFLSMGKAREKASRLSALYGLNVDLDAEAQESTVGMQQRVEILKMLYRDNEILIFDEPTAMLTPQEITEFTAVMRKLASEGKSIVFITHKLAEIAQTADRCTVLRKGKKIATVDAGSVSADELSEMMVGRKVSLVLDKKLQETGSCALKVTGLTMRVRGSSKNKLDDVSFEVNRGEIVCLAGIEGNGQSELIHAITGLSRDYAGKIEINGVDVSKSGVRARLDAGMSHIPEDRQRHGFVAQFSLMENLVLEQYAEPRFSRAGFLRFGEMASHAQDLIDRFDIRSASGPASLMGDLSGGNQQKAVIAREIDQDHDLLIAVQPSRGLDVGAIEYVHNKLLELRDKGKAVLLMSLELDEILGLSDRILVMFEGKIAGRLRGGEADRMELGRYMSGLARDEKN